jgi:histidine triad (HIT) family protein
MASVFTKIIRGEFPSYKILETEEVLAFLSIDPIAPGHTLVVPKVEVDQFADVPEPYYSAVFKVAQTVGRAIQTATGCRRVGMAVQGFEVPHFHLHLIPLNGAADFDFRHARRASPEELAETQKRVVAKLKS